jgi:hypothetical protein
VIDSIETIVFPPIEFVPEHGSIREQIIELLKANPGGIINSDIIAAVTGATGAIHKELAAMAQEGIIAKGRAIAPSGRLVTAYQIKT